MSLLLLPLPHESARAARLAPGLGADVAAVAFHRFPDGESYVRLDADATGRDVVVLSTMVRPDEKLAPLLFAAAAARERGARRVLLAAPYLAYMRQDASFRPGEAVTARVVAKALSGAFDAVVTIDPHLHRVASLGELYAVPTIAVSAAPSIAEFVGRTVSSPLLVGPDAESGRWVGAVAERLGAPCVVFEKTRQGDREVSIGGSAGIGLWRGRTPVLVDDIISTGRTMIGAASLLQREGFAKALVIGVHAVLGPRARDELAAAHVERVVTCDTIEDPTNAIPLDAVLVEGVLAAVARSA